MHVVCLVSDQGSPNMGLAKELGITPGSTSFPNPSRKGASIHWLYDVPHIIKNLRNNFFDHGFQLPSGTVVDSSILWKLLDKIDQPDQEYSIHPKLTRRHLECANQDRQRVFLATQLFSSSTALALRKLLPDDPSAQELASFIQLTDSWFDVTNSRVKVDKKKPLRSGFRVNGTIQCHALVTFANTIDSIVVCGKKSHMKWQTGALISCKSILSLYTYLREQYGVTYYLTAHVNQDILESTFSQIRAMWGSFTTPGGLEFKRRLRKLILGGCADLAVEHSAVLNQDNTVLLTRDVSFDLYQDPVHEDLQPPPLLAEDLVDSITGESFPASRPLEQPCPFSTYSENEGFNYFCGYVSLKGRNASLYTRVEDAPNRGEFITSDFIEEKSGGGLVYASKILATDISLMKQEFEMFHYSSHDGLSREKGIITNLVQQIQPKFPQYHTSLIRRFVMGRTKMRLVKLRQVKLEAKKVSQSARSRKKAIDYSY